MAIRKNLEGKLKQILLQLAFASRNEINQSNNPFIDSISEEIGIIRSNILYKISTQDLSVLTITELHQLINNYSQLLQNYQTN